MSYPGNSVLTVGHWIVEIVTREVDVQVVGEGPGGVIVDDGQRWTALLRNLV